MHQPMEHEMEEHLASVKDTILKHMDLKYRVGQKEHGGKLWERNIAREIMGESTDLGVYSTTLLQQYIRFNRGAEYIKVKIRALQVQYEIKKEDITGIEMVCDMIDKLTK